MSQAEVLYKIFRKHYSRGCKFLENDLNSYISNFSYLVSNKLNIQDHIYHAVIGIIESKTKLLVSKITDSFIRISYDLIHELSSKYMKMNDFKLKPNLALVYDLALEKINLFARRICLAIQSEIEIIILTEQNPYEKIYEIFPVESNTGKFHSRLKTMCYMNLLLVLNYLFDLINRTNNVKSKIVNLSEYGYPYDTELTENNNEFKFKRHKEMRNIVWERKGNYFVGEIPPSHFGSKEIVQPFR